MVRFGDIEVLTKVSGVVNTKDKVYVSYPLREEDHQRFQKVHKGRTKPFKSAAISAPVALISKLTHNSVEIVIRKKDVE